MNRVKWNEGRSVHIGVNRVSPVFRGHLPELQAAENDAEAMRSWANSAGCSARVILGEEATRKNVLDAVESTIERLVGGDLLLLSFAGHGVSLRGVGIEEDGWDEGWCLFDGVLIDDELHRLLTLVPSRCEVVVVSDTCFAGGVVDAQVDLSAQPQTTSGLLRDRAEITVQTNLLTDSQANTFKLAGVPPSGIIKTRAPRPRAADDEIAKLLRHGEIPSGRVRVRGRATDILSEVVVLSAADEGELAFEGSEHGLFTAALMGAIDGPDGEEFSYQELIRLVQDAITVQHPSIGVIGASTAAVSGTRALARATVLAVEPNPDPR